MQLVCILNVVCFQTICTLYSWYVFCMQQVCIMNVVCLKTICTLYSWYVFCMQLVCILNVACFQTICSLFLIFFYSVCIASVYMYTVIVFNIFAYIFCQGKNLAYLKKMFFFDYAKSKEKRTDLMHIIRSKNIINIQISLIRNWTNLC